MGIKNLKKQNKKLNLDLVDVISQLDPSESGKLMPFLLKMYKKRFLINEKEDVKSIKSAGMGVKSIKSAGMDVIIKEIISDNFGYENLEYLTKFNEHLENKRIENPDITSYNDWDQIRSEVAKTEMKILDKELSKQVEVIHQDETWLILKPLSFKASLVYGSNTRWCTSMKNECEYFYRYSKNGILVYTLNKSNGKKYAFYSSPEEFSVWNQVDNRIDSLETNIPFELLLKIKEFSDLEHNVTNFYKFSVEEVQNYENMMNMNKKAYYDEEPLVIGQPLEIGVEIDGLAENGTR